MSTGAVWMGRSVSKLSLLGQVDYLQGAGFGLIAKGFAIATTPMLGKLIKQNRINDVLSNTLGGFAAYGVSHLGVTLGFTAAPITIPAAVTLTVMAIAVACYISTDRYERI